MKKYLLFMILVLSLAASREAMAGYCLVYSEGDSSTSDYTLRGIVTNTYNAGGSGSNCTPPTSDSGWQDPFDQVIVFATLEWKKAADVNEIVLGSPITFDNDYLDLVIGNWDPDVIEDAESDILSDSTNEYYDDYTNPDYTDVIIYDYGRVVIDAKTNFEADVSPFECGKKAKNVYFRHLAIQTNGVSKEELFTGCLKDGGDNLVCYGDVKDDPLSNPSGWCDNDQDGYAGDEDCDDEDATVHDDCDGGKDGEGKDGEEEDVDGDGYTTDEGDCDDNDASVHPGATETCNDTDDDCDDQTDEDLTDITSYPDNDGDGYGDESSVVTDCSQPDGYVTTGGDCDDDDSAINPGEAEICDDSVDNDCDEMTDDADEDCACTPTIYYPDNDADGYGDADSSLAVESCETPSGYIDNNEDCDDADSAINPSASEVCGDGMDNDCDGSTDEGSTWYVDSDGDGYGSDSSATQSCDQPDGYIDIGGDCDDSNDSISPLAEELCEDGVDNNCDDVIDGDDSITCQITEVPDDEFGFQFEGGSGCSLSSEKTQTGQNFMIFSLLSMISWVLFVSFRRGQKIF